jgi:anti-sigma B factor antagonist
MPTRPVVEPLDGGDVVIEMRRSGQDELVVVEVRGELDILSMPRLRTKIREGLALPVALLVLDLERVTFLGTTGLAGLAEIRSMARERGCGLRLVCRNRQVLRPLELTGLVGLFTIHAWSPRRFGNGASSDPDAFLPGEPFIAGCLTTRTTGKRAPASGPTTSRSVPERGGCGDGRVATSRTCRL